LDKKLNAVDWNIIKELKEFKEFKEEN